MLGELIVFEGVDGAGKSTVSKLLLSRMEALGKACILMTFPGKEAGTLGKLVYDLHHFPMNYGLARVSAVGLQAMHIAAHLDSIESLILPKLMAGTTVILDRFWWSTLVYGLAAGADPSVLELLVKAEKSAWKSIQPKAVFLLSRIPKSAPESQSNPGGIGQLYESLAEQESPRYPVHRLNNSVSLDEVIGIVEEKLRSQSK